MKRSAILTATATATAAAASAVLLAGAPADGAPRWRACKHVSPPATSAKGKVRGTTSCGEAREVVAQWLRSANGRRPKIHTTVAPSLGPWYCVANYRHAGRAKVTCRVPKATSDYRYARIYFAVAAE